MTNETESSGQKLGYGTTPADSDEVKIKKIEKSTQIYNSVVFILGAVILVVIIICGIIIYKNIGVSNPATIPDGLIAIGSAAVGALAGLLAQTPASAG
jgi:hypothetical protein